MLSSVFGGVESEYPDSVSATVARSNASKQCTTNFNAAGTLLAVGCSDGAVAIYDAETKAVAKLLVGHAQPCVAVSWSRNSHHLLSAYTSGLIVRWNVLAGTQASYATIAHIPGENAERRIKNIQLHPDIADLAILNFHDHDHPLLVELEPLATPAEGLITVSEASPRPPLWSRFISTPYQPFVPPPAAELPPAATDSPVPADAAVATAAAPDASSATPTVAAAVPEIVVPDDPRQYYSKWASTTAIFDHSGRFIFEGNSKGTVFAYQLLWDRDLHASSAPALVEARGATSFPSCAQLRLIHVESNLAQNARSRVPVSIVHSIVQSPCCTYLMCNNSNQLKVYRLESSLMADAPGADEARVVHNEKLLLEPTTQQILENGSLISLEVERHARMRTERERRGRLNPKPKQPIHRAVLDRNGLPKNRSRKKRDRRDTSAGANEVANEEANAQEKTEEKAEVEPDQDMDETADQAKETSVKEEGDVAVKEEGDATIKEETDLAVKEESETPIVKDETDPTTTKDEEKTTEAATAVAAAATPATPAAAVDVEMGVSADVDGSAGAPVLSSLFEYTNTFSDQVNRVPWRKVCFSHSSDFIIAGSAERGEHRIHIWSIHSGQLTKILLGPTEGLLDLATHPTRPILVTCCTSGVIYVWSKNYVENWSAFAPDFEELDDNQEYVEKEDEFDIVPLGARKGNSTAGVEVDIATLEPCTRTGDLLTLPATVQSDVETEAAYRIRQQYILEAEEKLRQAAAQAIATNAPPATPATPASPSAKRPLEEQATNAAEDHNAKRAKL